MLLQLSLIAEPDCKRSYWFWSSSSQRHEISCKQKVCPQRFGCKKLYVSSGVSAPSIQLSDQEESVPCCLMLEQLFSPLMQNSVISIKVLSGCVSHGEVGGAFMLYPTNDLKGSHHRGSYTAVVCFATPSPSPPIAPGVVVSRCIAACQGEFDLQRFTVERKGLVTQGPIQCNFPRVDLKPAFRSPTKNGVWE